LARSEHFVVGAPMNRNLDDIEMVLLDLDGTIHLGGVPIPGALEFIERCKMRNIAPVFLSNNSSRSVKEYIQKLHKMGIDAKERDVLLSTHDCIRWLKQKGWLRIHCFGTGGMKEMMEEAGIDCSSKEVDCVVVGYHTDLVYADLQRVSELLHKGLPLVATHPDIVCPSPSGGLPDVGAILSLLEVTTGVKPVIITGKPRPEMILGRLEQDGVAPSKVAMIGDRIYTDMAMAMAAGVHSVLVLSGEAQRDDLDNMVDRPTLVVESVDDLLR
tara:strand:+ start:20 stop:832 length:813 start_codon:yes stop_codon:yes gene_type:complete